MPFPKPRKAPGPPALPATGHLYRFRRDVLGMLLRSVRDYGDVVRFRLVHKVFHLVNHPDYAEHVLHGNAANYDKETPSSDKIRDVCGDSLLTLNGEPWKRRRRLMQPAFVQDELAGFVPVMTDATAAMLDRWWARRPGEAFDMSADMMALAFTIVGRTLFGADLSGDVHTVESTFETVMAHTYARLGRVIDLPPSVPTRGNRKFTRALAELDG